MAKGEFADGDANAAAMAELAAKTDAQRAKDREASEKKAKRRVVLTAGDVAEIVRCLADDTEFAQRFTSVKEYRQRTDAIVIVNRNTPLLAKLRAKIPEYVADREGGQGT